jgi:hypothetical protein
MTSEKAISVARTMARSCGTNAATRRMVSTRALVRKEVLGIS